MRKKYLRKAIALVTVTMSIMAFNPIGASAEWKQDNTGWWYKVDNSWLIGWMNIDGKYYYFSSNGYMAHDAIIDGYYLGADGAWVQNNMTQGESNLEDFTMKTEKSVYELGTNEIRVYITNNTNKASDYGESYALEKFENNKWNNAASKVMSFNAMASLIEANRTHYQVISLFDCSDNLTSGKYRIVKEINKLKVTAEFDIK
jgi:hypothetical protein